MGFQVPRKTARLQFEGDEFDNCEVVVALDLTFGASMQMDKLREKAGEDIGPLLVFFAENCILSWNLEDKDGNSLPISDESLVQFPSWFSLLIISGYKEAMEQASGVSAPLEEPSQNGSTPEEQSVMTEARSSAPESSPAPSS